LHERCQELANLTKNEEKNFWKVFPPKYFFPFCLCSQHPAQNSSTQKSSTTCKSQENNKIIFSKDFFSWQNFPIFCMFQATDPKSISTKRVHNLPLERKSQIEINVLLKSLVSGNFFSPDFENVPGLQSKTYQHLNFSTRATCQKNVKSCLFYFKFFEQRSFLSEWFCVSFRTTQAQRQRWKASISEEKTPRNGSKSCWELLEKSHGTFSKNEFSSTNIFFFSKHSANPIKKMTSIIKANSLQIARIKEIHFFHERIFTISDMFQAPTPKIINTKRANNLQSVRNK